MRASMRASLLAALPLAGLAGAAAAGPSPVLQTLDYANTRYSALDQIDAGNVGRLKVAWTFSTGVLRGHEGAPIVVGHVLYVHTPFPNAVYALDLDQGGKILWRYAPRQDASVIAVMCCDTVSRGLAYADGRLFLQQADTTVVALDPETGRVLWSVRNGDPGRGETNTATVLPVHGKLIVGLAGASTGRAATSPPTIRRRVSGSGAPTPPGRTPTCWSIRRRRPSSGARSAGIPRSGAGRATSGGPAAPAAGAGSPTTRT